MSICIKGCFSPLVRWFEARPSAKQWVWFVLLWGGGLGAALAVSWPIKWLILAMG